MKKFLLSLLVCVQVGSVLAWSHTPRFVQWERMTHQEHVALAIDHNVSLELALLSAVYFGNITLFEHLYRIAYPVSFAIHIDGVDISFADCIALLCNAVIDDFEMQKAVCEYFDTKGYTFIPSCNDYVGVCLSLAAARDAMHTMYECVEINQPSYYREDYTIDPEVVTEILSTLLALYQVQPAEDHKQTLAHYAHVTFTIAGVTMTFSEVAQFIAFEHEYIANNNKSVLHDILADCPELTEEGYERFYRSRLRWHMTLARRAAYNVDYINSMCL